MLFIDHIQLGISVSHIQNLTLCNLVLYDCVIYLGELDSINIHHCIFGGGSLGLANEVSQKIYNCNFNDTNISFSRGTFEECKFNQCRIRIHKDIDWDKVLLKNCIFEECALYVAESVGITFFNNKELFKNCAIIVEKSDEEDDESSHYEEMEEDIEQ